MSHITAPRYLRRNVTFQAAGLMLLWLILSGHYDFFHIALGVVSVAAVLLINRRRIALPVETETADSIRWSRAARYLPWLIKEMIVSGIHVARVVWSPTMPIRPRVVCFKSAQPNDMARVILGNSITLTPGTLTLDLAGDEIVVHALTETTAAGLLNGTMQTKVANLYTDEPRNMVFDANISREIPLRKRR